MIRIPFPVGHPSLERLRAFADGEVIPVQRTGMAAHLERCTRCRESIVMVRTVRSAARDDLAPPAPADALATVLARRAAGERRILPPPYDSRARGAHFRPSRSRLRIAGVAVVTTLAAAGAAAALSAPLRDWVAALFGIEHTQPVPHPSPVDLNPAAAAGAATADEPAAEHVAGAAIEMRAESLWIDVDAPNPRVRLRVHVTEGRRLEVRGIGAAADAVFRPRADGIGVTVSGAGELQLHLPRTARYVIVRLNAVPYLVKENGQLRVLAPGADTIGTDLLLIPSR